MVAYNLILVFLTSVTPLLLLIVIKFIHKMWWIPNRIKRVMASQGIKGPPYRFIHGNTKEIASMKDQENTRKVIGISHDIYPRIQPHFFTWVELYGKNFLNWYGPQAELVITEAEIIREIASNRSVSLSRPDLGSYNKKILGDGLVTSSGKKWASQRKLANHAFNGESLKNMTPKMVESVELMLLRWKELFGSKVEVEVEMNAELRMLTSEVISRTAFGSSYLQGKEIFEMLKEMSTIASRNYYNPQGLFRIVKKSSDEFKSDELQKKIQDLIMESIKERQMMMMSDTHDFLGHLLSNNQLSTQDIIDECKTFYISGDATTSLLLSWAILLLSIHTQWQERARHEVFQIFGKKSPHFEGLAKLKLIGMIIHETLRLYPPGTAIIRKSQQQVKLGTLTVPANVILHVPVLALHHDRRIWGEDTHLFKPERFSQGISNATPWQYMPFGLGPRNCVGSNFATNTAKVTLSMILQNYQITPSMNYVHSPAHVMMLVPKNGVQVMLHALN